MIDRIELVLMLLEDFFEKSDDELIELAERELGLSLIERNVEDGKEVHQLFEGEEEDVEYELQDATYLKQLLMHYHECVSGREVSLAIK